MLDKNENKSDDMVEIMSHLLKYTPVVEYNEDVQVEGDTNVVERASVYPILFVIIMFSVPFHHIFKCKLKEWNVC